MEWLSALLLCIVSISMPGLTSAASSPVDSVTGDTPYILQPESGEPCNPSHDKPTCSLNRQYVVFCHATLRKWVPSLKCRDVVCPLEKTAVFGPDEDEQLAICFPPTENPTKLPDYILTELNTSPDSDSESTSSNQQVQARRVPNPECEPGKMKCDFSYYAAMICDEQGTWKVSRKCLKPGCCELAQLTWGGDVVARCKTECGPGQTPPGNIPSPTQSVVVPESTSSSAVETSVVEDTPYGVLPTTLARIVNDNQAHSIPIVCEPGEQKCTVNGYAALVCDENGHWKISRKCHKPGCCKLVEAHIAMKSYALCKKECEPGQSPTDNIPSSTSYSAAVETSIVEDTPYGVRPTTLARVVNNDNQARRSIPNPECEPGDQKCDDAHYAALHCDEKGTWKVSRKCLKPGCCEVIEFQIDLKPYAQCKKECGPGQTPPGNIPSSTRVWSMTRTRTRSDWWKSSTKSKTVESTSSSSASAPAAETSAEDSPYEVLPTTLARAVLAA